MASVDTPNSVYKSREDQWRRCRDCSLGSDAVKGAGIIYLPPLDSHKKESLWLNQGKYGEYKDRALFYNATLRTIQGLSGAIFQKAPSVKPMAAKDHIADITLAGEPFEMFALFSTKENLTTGKIGILVDMSDQGVTDARPYWVGYESENVINWRYERIGGDAQLVFVVLKEDVEDVEDDDEFSSETITQYRVLRLKGNIYSQQLYKPIKDEKSGKTEYVPDPEIIPLRRGTPLNFIPFAIPWTSPLPPLLDLVDVNLAHYRASADLKHGLHFTALPTPWVSGQKGSSDKPLAMGAGVAWDLDVNGKAGMLEFTGKGLGAVAKDMENMEKMMATLGARLLEAAPHYAETALSVSMRHSSDYATLRTIAQIVEQQLSYAMKIHDWWLQPTLKRPQDSEADVQLNKVFFDQAVTADELRALLMALQGGAISYDTFYARLANTGWTREGITAEMELAGIKKDGDQFKLEKPGLQEPDPKSTAPGSKPTPKPGSGMESTTH